MIKESRIDSKTSSSGIASKEDKYWKRILIVDDEVDITTTLKLIIENANKTSSRRIVVDLHDLLLIDINMPYMDGFKLSEKILDIDLNVKICYMSAGEISRDALREIHPSISLGCFIIKPVSNDYLICRIIAELD